MVSQKTEDALCNFLSSNLQAQRWSYELMGPYIKLYFDSDLAFIYDGPEIVAMGKTYRRKWQWNKFCFSNPFDDFAKDYKETKLSYSNTLAITPSQLNAVYTGMLPDLTATPVPPETIAALDAVEEENEIISVHRTYSLNWKVVNGQHRPVLEGVFAEWIEREFIASCDGDKDRVKAHLATVKGEYECFCGIHGMKDREKIHREAGVGQVIAECTLYGWILPYTEGYRAEKGRIEHCWLVTNGDPLPDEKRLADVISKTYGVPCETVPKYAAERDLTAKDVFDAAKYLLPSLPPSPHVPFR